MPEDVVLKFCPSSRDCLSWSEDGELAVAAGSDVHLLVPRRSHLDSPETLRADSEWHEVDFTVNVFSQREWPTATLDSLRSFDIGLEQSQSHVVSLIWSPPGLGRHKRPVLAVLTQNGLLSIWASDSDFRDTRSWSRHAIINSCLEKEKHVVTRPRNYQSPPNYPQDVVTAFDWLHYERGVAFLAVLTNSGDVNILRLQSVRNNPRGSLEIISKCKFSTKSHMVQANEADVPLKVLLIAQACPPRIQWRKHPSESDTISLDVQVKGIRDVFGIVIKHEEGKLIFGDVHRVGLSAKGVLNSDRDIAVKMLDQPRLHSLGQKFRSDHECDVVRWEAYGQAVYRDFLATSCSLHPDDVPAYTIPSQQRSTLFFTWKHNLENTGGEVTFPWRARPSSKRPIDVLRTAFQFLRHGHVLKRKDEADHPSSPTMHPCELDSQLLFALLQASIVSGIDTTCLQVEETFADLSLDFRGLFDVTQLRKLMDGTDIDQDRDRVVNEMISARLAYEESARSSSTLLQYCLVAGCGSVLLWKGSGFECKQRGHYGGSYPRCAITFFAIQEPGISKLCDSCGRSFLETTGISRVEQQFQPLRTQNNFNSDNVQEKPLRTINTRQADDLSSAKALLAHFEVCPYCGGKYFNNEHSW